MGLFVNIFFLFVATSLFAISGGFITNAAVRLTGIKNYSETPKLVSAHKYASISAVTTWLTIPLMLVAIVLYIIFGLETVEFTGSIFIISLLFLALVGTVTIGILSAITAEEINKSGVADNNLAYRQSVIAAVLAIAGGIFLIVGILFYFFYKPKPKKTEEDALASTLKAELGEGLGEALPEI